MGCFALYLNIPVMENGYRTLFRAYNLLISVLKGNKKGFCTKNWSNQLYLHLFSNFVYFGMTIYKPLRHVLFALLFNVHILSGQF